MITCWQIIISMLVTIIIKYKHFGCGVIFIVPMLFLRNNRSTNCLVILNTSISACSSSTSTLKIPLFGLG